MVFGSHIVLNPVKGKTGTLRVIPLWDMVFSSSIVLESLSVGSKTEKHTRGGLVHIIQSQTSTELPQFPNLHQALEWEAELVYV